MVATRLRQALQAVLFSLGRRRPLLGPAKLAWEVTEACNSRCLTCSRREQPAPGELDTRQGLDLIDQIQDLGVLSLSFSGGEPLVRRDFPLLVAHAARRGLHTSVSTNGLLLKGDMLSRLLDAGLCSVYLSLDGACAETNDRLRGISGGFSRVCAAAEELLTRRRQGRPRVFFNTTVSRANVDELPALADLAVSTGVDGLTLQPAQLFSEARLEPDSDLVLSAADAPRVEAALQAILAAHPRLIPLPAPYLEKMDSFIESPEVVLSIPCVAAYMHAVIGSTGTVYPCPVEFAPMGNVKEQSLREIWWGADAAALRERIARGDHPACWFNCIVPASLILHDLLPFGWLRLLGSPAGGHLIRRLKGTPP